MQYPLLPLRGVLVFPGLVVPLEIGRERSVRALEKAWETEHRLVFASQRDPRDDEPNAEDLFPVGVVCEIKQVVKLPDGTWKAVVYGERRVRIDAFADEKEYFLCDVEPLEEIPAPENEETEASMRSIIHLYEQYLKLGRKMPGDATLSISTDEPGRLCDAVASNLEIKIEERQEVLETLDVEERLMLVHRILTRQIDLLELERKIHSRVRRQMEKTQKEYYLREQIKAIQRELGEHEDPAGEADEWRKKIEQAKLPKEAQEKALREVDRLEHMPQMSAEAVVVRTYLEWLTSLPWEIETEDSLELKDAQRILDEDHYGLKKVKDRILDYLAVRALQPEIKGPILCLVGPPGVGKTSLGRSVARALGRKFVRISLGGVRDEAEVRGHRRTYVGALPGRIIQGMRQAGSKNPVFLLDEVDKMAQDFRGDPSAALLEVLDPSQNAAFSDHYIELPFDLSHVLFITTANLAQQIPQPLLDRMETITIPGYTEDEKVQIATRHLLARQMAEHGLKPQDLELGRGVLESVVQGYTREAGVRSLERQIAALCRKAARRKIAGRGPLHVTPKSLEKALGPRHFHGHTLRHDDEVGVATALYWTEVGGDAMPIEVTVVPGKGNLVLTGKLGEVMRESAQAGYTYVRSRRGELGIGEEFPDHVDVHIHVPEGATPKEGPSAGITMATALASALSGRAVRADLAMTGEITLRGRVLPIGGLKEKTLAAHRLGVRTLIVPQENARDLEDLPQKVRHSMDFVLVENMDQVLETALKPAPAS
ncbi:MAG: endopeptidase La [Thermaerobacter sp.]|nr:endopeptidase La [Thermaerobacter sp.]